MRLFLLILLIPNLIGCSSSETGNEELLEESARSTTNTFPFGLDPASLNQEPVRILGGGDCWSTIRSYVTDTTGLVTDSTDCGENGTFQSFYFLKKRKINLVHEQKSEVNFSEDGKKATFILFEIVYDFTTDPAIESTRTDTLSVLDFSKIKKEFVVSEIKNSKAILNELTEKLKKRLTEPQNFENAEFKLVSTPSKEDKTTGTPSTEISLSSPVLSNPIFIVKETNLSEIKEYQQRENMGIPGYATFAFSSWYAGGGAIYYGVIENNLLKIYRKYQDEQEVSGANKFQMLNEIDLENPTQIPDYYICFKEDKNKSPNVMIAFDKSGKAIYAKYEKQAGRIQIKFIRDELKNDGAYPTTISQYKEMVNNQRTGKYTITHSGNWDYLEYRRAKDGKIFNFTIDHNLSIDENGYRKTPCF